MDFGFGNTPNSFKAQPEIKAKSSKIVNSLQYQPYQSANKNPSQFNQEEKLKQNIKDTSINNKSLSSKVFNSHLNKAAYLSGKYYSLQPHMNYTIPSPQQNYQNYNFKHNSNY